ncbi:hypothetical protein GCM10009760_17140 [Kitasatospora kazusensis]|uniref:Uncharacterized protein n=1 Tax=Kitasatospora kazusensis TaxID=407974 RepID=A0ABP5KTB6_9ACTN
MFRARAALSEPGPQAVTTLAGGQSPGGRSGPDTLSDRGGGERPARASTAPVRAGTATGPGRDDRGNTL